MNTTKLELCNRVAKRLSDKSLPIVELKPVLEMFLDEILNVLSEGKKIEIRGFGSFKTKNRKTRIGRNPRTGDAVKIPAYTAPYFKFSRDALKIFSDKMVFCKKAGLPKKEHKTVIEKVSAQPVQSDQAAAETAKSAETFSV
jgi:nucleoid DNA-binding protein